MVEELIECMKFGPAIFHVVPIKDKCALASLHELVQVTKSAVSVTNAAESGRHLFMSC